MKGAVMASTRQIEQARLRAKAAREKWVAGVNELRRLGRKVDKLGERAELARRRYYRLQQQA